MIRSRLRALGAVLPSLARRLARGPAILLYHRVAARRCDPFGLQVSAAQFREHLEVITREHEVYSLAELGRRARAGEMPSGGVAVTFDDGYRDNLATAAPLLARFGVPATFFVTTGALDAPRAFWWDELVRAILEPAALPARLELETGARRFSWATGAPQSRAHAFDALYALMIRMPEPERDAVLERLVAWAGLAHDAPEEDRSMSAAQVQSLAAMDRVEIGAHSVTHAPLTWLPAAERLAEMRRSRATLEEIAGRAVTSFAYPYGIHDRASIAAARAAGFDLAATCLPGRVHARCDLLRLPRLEVRPCGGEELARSLRQRLAGNVGAVSSALEACAT